MSAMADRTVSKHHSDTAGLTERLRSAVAYLGDQAVLDHPLGPLCTYRVGGSAQVFVAARDQRELLALAEALAPIGAEIADAGLVHVIGKGSNLLVSDGGVEGLVIQLGDGFDEVTVLDDVDEDRVVVRLGASLSLPVAARQLARRSLVGFEWAVGIPGSIGGALRMNAGGHGDDLAAVLSRVHLIDLSNGKAVVVDALEMDLGYRTSSLLDHQVVTAVEIGLAHGDATAANERLSEIVRWRRENQPGGANAGSVFTNPPGDSAGRLIDTAGCRGLRIGTAEVSPKHANFIQADPNGRADDVMALMRSVVERVESEHGVRLHAETVLLGFSDEDVRAVKGSGGLRR